MGTASYFTADRTIRATNERTGRTATLQVWREPAGPGQLCGTESVAMAGGGPLTTLAKGRYQDLAGDVWASDDPDAP